jgi:5-methylcytosine-specific restriction endonuclease McrA
VQFTASAELHDKLERLRALMRSQVPDGDLAAIIERAVSEKLERLQGRRFAKTSRPRKTLRESDTSPSSRRIPAAVRREVYQRDGGRCRYVDESGRRCSERDRLEYHHRHPFGVGGDHSPTNIRLMCRTHNAHIAEHDYGRKPMARYRRSGNLVPVTAFAASAAPRVTTAGASPLIVPAPNRARANATIAPVPARQIAPATSMARAASPQTRTPTYIVPE